MAKKILAVAYDTGVGNDLFKPILKLNDDKKLETIVLSEGPSRAVYDSKYINYKTLESHGLNGVTQDNVDLVIEKEKPDLILTGFSEGVMLEKYSILNAKSRGIPSLTILGGYTNYLKVVSDEEIKEPFKHMPDFICIMDEFVLDKMLKLNFDKYKLLVTGNPYFDDLIRLRHSFDAKNIREIKKELGVDENSYLITFVSQAIKKVLDKNTENRSRGYNEIDVLNLLEETLHKLHINNLNLLVRLHPKEDLESTKGAFSGKLDKIILNNDRKYDPRKFIIIPDLVIGMFSTSLIEAVYLDKEVISIQPNMKVQDTLIMNELGLIVPVYKQENLKLVLEKVIYDGSFREELKQKRTKLNLDGKATERVVNFIYKLLNID